MHGVEMQRCFTDSGGRMQPQVEPLRRLRQGFGIDLAQQDLDESGDDSKFFRGKKLRLIWKSAGLDIIRLAAGRRRPLLAGATERVDQMFR